LKGNVRKFIFLWMILLTLCGNSIAGGDKYSFRIRGLGTNLYGLISDLYTDIYFNPAYLSRFNKTWIFTNLSNLQGRKDISVFGDDFSLKKGGDLFPSNLYGAITRIKGRTMGIFWESSGYDLSMKDENIKDTYSSASEGIRNKNNLNIDGDFSSRSITIMGLYRGWGYIFSMNKYGFEVGYNEEDWNGNFALSDTTGEKVFSSYELNNLKRRLKFPGPRFGFSLGKVFKKRDTELSFSAGVRPERITFNANTVFSVFKQPFFGSEKGDFGKISDRNFGFMEIGLKSYFLNIRYKIIEPGLKTFKETNFLFSFNRNNLPIELEAEETASGDTLLTQGLVETKKNVSIISTSKGKGSGSINRLILGYGKEKHFDNLKSMLALGVKCTFLWGSMSYKQGPGEKRVSQLITENGNSVLDTTMVYRDNRIFESRGEAKGIIFSLPVGLETKLSEKFTFRLGANAWIPITFNGKWKKKVKDLPDTAADTSMVYTPAVTVPDEKQEVSDIKGKMLNLTSYYFGASYDISKSIRIDFLHFANLTRLDTWWLSIILKY